MKTIALALPLLLCLTAIAFAQKVDPLTNEAAVLAPNRTDCITSGYDWNGAAPGGSIPDNDPSGVYFGPLPTLSNGPIQDVILSVEMEHTWLGDLRMFLLYDPTCTGSFEAQGSVLCRPGVDGCAAGGLDGCSGILSGAYQFDDTEPVSLEDICYGFIPNGCYGPDYDSYGFDIFDGYESGGCFWLHVVDVTAYDEGFVDLWSVYVLTGDTPVTEAPLDIKPTSCPNPLNVKSRGVLPVAILSTDSFDATNVDPDEVSLEGVEPIRWDWSDVATPLGGDPDPCDCHEEGPDGLTDMTLKFSTQEIVAALGAVSDGDEVELTLTGELMDGTPFTASDCVWILDRGGNPHTATLNGDAVEITAPRPVAEDTSWTTIKALYR